MAVALAMKSNRPRRLNNRTVSRPPALYIHAGSLAQWGDWRSPLQSRPITYRVDRICLRVVITTCTDERYYSTWWDGRKCSMSNAQKKEKANYARLFERWRFLLGRWKQTDNFQILKNRTGYRSYFSLCSSQFLSSCLPCSLSLLN